MGFIGKAARASAIFALFAIAQVNAATLTDYSRVECLADGQQLPIYSIHSYYAYEEDDPATPEDERGFIENEFNSSAVIIRPGYALTTQHSVSGSYDSIIVHTPLGDREAVVMAADPVNDMALLRLDTKGLENLPISREPVKIGQRLWNVGYPSSDKPVSYGGTLLAIPGGALKVAIPAFPGMSGGGIVGCSDGVPVLAGIIQSFNLRRQSYRRVITEEKTVIKETLVNLGTSNGPSNLLLFWFVEFAIAMEEVEQQEREQEQQ